MTPRPALPLAIALSLATALVTAVLAATLGLGGCGGAATADPGADLGRRPPRPGPQETLIAIDGVTITFGDLQPQLDYLHRLAPEFSDTQLVLKVLPEFTLPLVFARREFAAARQKQFELARTVRAVCENTDELTANSTELPHQRATISRGDVAPPVAEFLFDPLHLGAVSQPIEVPTGWVLASPADLKPSPAAMEDLCDALIVGFGTHDANAWRDWLRALPDRLCDKVTYVHPDFRLGMPPWMRLP